MAAGYRSPLGIWLGGAAAPPPQAGVRSLLAFWLGGAVAGPVVDPPPPVLTGGGGWVPLRISVPDALHMQRLEEDELIMLVIAGALRGLI